jgi:hypothetical protein
MIDSAMYKVCPCGCGTLLLTGERRMFVNNAHKQAWYRITKWAKGRARKWVDSLCNGDMSYYSEAYYYYVRKGIDRRQDRLADLAIPDRISEQESRK